MAALLHALYGPYSIPAEIIGARARADVPPSDPTAGRAGRAVHAARAARRRAALAVRAGRPPQPQGRRQSAATRSLGQG